MKKLLLFSCVVLAFLVGCDKNDTPDSQALTLSNEVLTLTSLGSTSQLSVTAPSSYASNPKLTWVSLNPAIASVSKTGVVTAIAPGSTTVYAFVDGLNAVRGECKVMVATSLKFTVDKTTLNAGDTVVGTFTYGDDAEIKAPVALSTSDTVGRKMIDASVILTQSEDGKQLIQTNQVRVIARSAGEVKLVVYSSSSKRVADTVVFTVTNIPVTAFAFKAGSVTAMQVGDKDTLSVDILPATAKNSPVTWRSNDESVLTVGENGDLVAKSRGTAVISAATAFDQVIMQTITVSASTADPKSFKFVSNEGEIYISDFEDIVPLTIELNPSTAQAPTLTPVPKAKLAALAQFKDKAVSDIDIVTSGGRQYAYAPADVSNTGMAAIVASNGTKDKDGNLITDTCWISITDVTDNVVLAKPVYNTVDFGKNTVVTAKMVNYMPTALVLDKAVLSRVDPVMDPKTGKQAIDAKGKPVFKTVVIETITPATSCAANGGAASASFKPVLTNTDQMATYAVTYTYTAGGLESTIKRAVVEDNGAAYSPAR